MAQDYKKAQIQGTASTGTYATLYTTPAGKQALISTILVCNTDVNNPVTVRVGFDDTAGTPDSALGEWLVYDAVVAAGDTLTLSLGISMGQEKFLRVSSSNTNANFTAFVVEIGASGNSILPAFLAQHSAGNADVTGDGTSHTMVWDTEVFDQGDDFNGTIFTAPVTGKYQINAMVRMSDFNNAGAVAGGYIYLITSNRNFLQYIEYTGAWPHAISYNISVLTDMDASDTAEIHMVAESGTKNVDILSNVVYNHFSAHLVA